MRQKNISYKNYEKKLEAIIRYEKFEVMFYRTNNLIHTKRIIYILEKLLPFILKIHPDIDVIKLFLLVWFHDAPEIITGDVSLQTKLIMSEGELRALYEKELIAIEILSDFFKKESFFDYNIKSLMLEAHEKSTLISQLASFVDKVDGFCEAFHEVLAGNNVFAEPVWNYPLETFSIKEQKYPLLNKLFKSEHIFFKKHIGDLKVYFQKGKIGPKLHNEETLKRITGFPYYELWKEVTIKNFGIAPLVVQKEFFI